MQNLPVASITTDEIELPLLRERRVTISILRLDKIHPVISGNKWFKLQRYFQRAREEKKNHIVTFGGAYSNHIVATAAAGKLYGYRTTGLIRGEKAAWLSPTLQDATAQGMELIFVSREEYRQRRLPPQLAQDCPELLIVDEGGYGTEGAEGAEEILACCDATLYSHIACAVGSTTTMAGLIRACKNNQAVIGISVLKGFLDAEKRLRALLHDSDREKKFSINHCYHFGGYARSTPQLLRFMNEFFEQTSVPLDFVYTGKMFYAIMNLITDGRFPPGSRILLIHSGGLQGNRSLGNGSLAF